MKIIRRNNNDSSDSENNNNEFSNALRETRNSMLDFDSNDDENDEDYEDEYYDLSQRITGPAYDPSEVVAYISKMFTECYVDRKLLSTLTSLSKSELTALIFAHYIGDLLFRTYGIISPWLSIVDNFLVLKIAENRKGRHEILSLVSRITGAQDLEFLEAQRKARRLFSRGE